MSYRHGEAPCVKVFYFCPNLGWCIYTEMFLVVKFIFWIVCHKLSLPEYQFHNLNLPTFFPENLEGDSISGEVLFDDIFE